MKKIARERNLPIFSGQFNIKYAAILFGFFLGGCRSEDLGNEKPLEVDISATSPTWAQVSALMEAKCMNCHATPRSAYAPTNTPALSISSAQGFYDSMSRIHARVFESQSSPMPPNFGTPLSENESNGLKAFVAQVQAAQQGNGQNPLPGVSVTPPSGGLSLSSAYSSLCSGCHGAQGQGVGSFPKLAGTVLGADAFVAKIRQGGGGMPAFSVSQIPDATAQSDHGLLKAASVPLVAAPLLHEGVVGEPLDASPAVAVDSADPQPQDDLPLVMQSLVPAAFARNSHCDSLDVAGPLRCRGPRGYDIDRGVTINPTLPGVIISNGARQ